MYWDVEDEHALIYDPKEAEMVNNLTNLFDIIFDYVHKDNAIYPMMMCVDVFLCGSKNPKKLIPEYICRCYSTFLSNENRYRMQENAITKLSCNADCEGDIKDILTDTFSSDTISNRLKNMEVLHTKIDMLADKLREYIDDEHAERYILTAEELKYLEMIYLGILTKGYIIVYGEYAFLVLVGSDE